MKTCVVIPTLNEAENISTLLNSLTDYKVIVVDDNSPDGTAAIAEKAGATVIRRPAKMGLGSAVREGVRKALEDKECTHIITMDADFSHDPKDVCRLLNTDKSFVIASRYVFGGKIVGWSASRRLTSKIANLICRTLLRTNTNDNTTNFRLYSRECAEVLLTVEGQNYEWPVLCLVAVKKAGFTAYEVPVTFINRQNGDSKLDSKHILRWLGLIVKEALK